MKTEDIDVVMLSNVEVLVEFQIVGRNKHVLCGRTVLGIYFFDVFHEWGSLLLYNSTF